MLGLLALLVSVGLCASSIHPISVPVHKVRCYSYHDQAAKYRLSDSVQGYPERQIQQELFRRPYMRPVLYDHNSIKLPRNQINNVNRVVGGVQRYKRSYGSQFGRSFPSQTFHQRRRPVQPVRPIFHPKPVRPVQPKSVQSYRPQPVHPIHPKPVHPVYPKHKPVITKPIQSYRPKPVHPIYPKPVHPVHPKPVHPVHSKPVQSYRPKPVHPIHPKPVHPVHPKPVYPVHPKPVYPIRPKPVHPIHPKPVPVPYQPAKPIGESCPSTKYTLRKFWINGGECHVINAAYQKLTYAKCGRRDCSNCAYTPTQNNNYNNRYYKPVNKCVENYETEYVWAYCSKGKYNERIARVAVSLPKYCSCKTFQC